MSSPTVLVLRALGLGDALTGVAALRGVRRAWPDHRLCLAAPAAVGQWLLAQGVVDETLDAAPLGPVRWPSPEPPEIAVNLHGRGPQSHRLLRALRPGRLVAFADPEAGHPDGPEWDAGEHEVDRWCRLVRSAGGACGPEDLRLESSLPRRDTVVVHPGAAAGSRRWPAERWRDVVAALAGDAEVVVTGTGAEAALCAEVAAAGAQDLCGRLPLPDLARAVAGARLLLSGDTGVAHLATAYATPSVVLFGPVPPSAWGPRIDPRIHAALWRPRDGDPPGDPHAEQLDPRLERITAGDVLAAARAVTAG